MLTGHITDKVQLRCGQFDLFLKHFRSLKVSKDVVYCEDTNSRTQILRKNICKKPENTHDVRKKMI